MASNVPKTSWPQIWAPCIALNRQDISSLFFQRNHILGWYRQSVRYWTTTSWTTTSWTWVHVGADLFALRESDEGTQFVTIYRQNHPIIFTPEIISTEDRWHIAACKKVFMHSNKKWARQTILCLENYQRGRQRLCPFSLASDHQLDRSINVSIDGNVLLG